MPIFKLQENSSYAKLSNDTLRDKRLSIEARGTLAYLLTHADTFELSFEFLQKELGIGRDKMNKIARELKTHGYLELRAVHNKKGKFSGQEWFIYAESQNTDFSLTNNNRPTEKPSDVKTVRRENRQTENTEDILKEKLRQKKSNKEENKKERERAETAPPPPAQFQISVRNLGIEESQQQKIERRDGLKDCNALNLFETTFNVTVGNATATAISERVTNLAVWENLIRDKIGFADEPLSKRNNIKNWIFTAYEERLQKLNGVNGNGSNQNNTKRFSNSKSDEWQRTVDEYAELAKSYGIN